MLLPLLPSCLQHMHSYSITQQTSVVYTHGYYAYVGLAKPVHLPYRYWPLSHQPVYLPFELNINLCISINFFASNIVVCAS